MHPSFAARRETTGSSIAIAGQGMKIKTATFITVLAIGFCSAAYAQSSGATTIHLHWTQTFDRLQPNPRDGITLTNSEDLVLHAGGAAQQIRSVALTRAREHTFHLRDGTRIGKNWRVAGPHSLTRTDVFPNSTRVFRITISGSSCSLSIENNLKPGAPYYLFPMISQRGRAGRYRNWRTSSTTCSIE
jgi:hypothetical protein